MERIGYNLKQILKVNNLNFMSNSIYYNTRNLTKAQEQIVDLIEMPITNCHYSILNTTDLIYNRSWR